jgi:hypothetical protein
MGKGRHVFSITDNAEMAQANAEIAAAVERLEAPTIGDGTPFTIHAYGRIEFHKNASQ